MRCQGCITAIPAPSEPPANGMTLLSALSQTGFTWIPRWQCYLQRLAGDQLVLVSDALAPYGLKDGVHHWDEGHCLLKTAPAGLRMEPLQA